MTKNYLTTHLDSESEEDVRLTRWRRTVFADDDARVPAHNSSIRVNRPPSALASRQRGGLTQDEQEDLLPIPQREAQDEGSEDYNPGNPEDSVLRNGSDSDGSYESDVVVVPPAKKHSASAQQTNPSNLPQTNPGPSVTLSSSALARAAQQLILESPQDHLRAECRVAVATAS